jgi:hypothetical protein
MLKLVLIAAAIGLLSGAANAAEKSDTPCKSITSIGWAEISKDGVIRLHLRSPGSIMEDELEYEPTNPKYESIKQHLGELTFGEITNVPPWCDGDHLTVQKR